MSRTTTTSHGLGKWDPGDHPRDDAPNDMNYNWDEIDGKLYGSGTVFPSSFAVGAVVPIPVLPEPFTFNAPLISSLAVGFDMPIPTFPADPSKRRK